ncbi:MAG: PD40 domain-containing protein [Bacteroidia bacterium]|nr:PD40 domain-containing protein [Bacteroidia bacterium]
MKKALFVLVFLQQIYFAQVIFTDHAGGENKNKNELNLNTFSIVRDFCLSSNQDELYFTAQTAEPETSVIIRSVKKNGFWLKPSAVKFSGKWIDMEPFLSEDGLRLYFASNRPLTDTGKIAKDFDIWFVERKNTQAVWGKPINCGAPINSNENEFYPCITTSKNFYFTSNGKLSKGEDDIFVCYFENGKYLPPVNVSDSINTKGYEFNAFITRDEKYMLFTGYNKPDGLGSGDIYISTKVNGSWTKPINMGLTINSPQMDYCPFVDEKTKTLYFTSKRFHSKEKEYRSIDEYELMQKNSDYKKTNSKLYQLYIGNWIN